MCGSANYCAPPNQHMGPACPITFNDGGQVLHALGHALLQPFAWRCLHPPPRLQPVAPARDDVHGSRASDAAGALPGVSASGSTGPDTLGSRPRRQRRA